jgi:hypothetical protein
VVSGGIEAEPPSGPEAAERSRRQLLSRGGILGAAALVAGCTSKVKQSSNVPLTSHTPGAQRDVELLNGLLRLEYRSIYAYTACIPLLPQPAPPPKHQKPKAPSPKSRPANAPPPPLELLVPLAYTAAQQFLTHQLAHVTELTGFIGQAGGHPVKPQASYNLGHPRTKQDVLILLHRIEQQLLTGYLEALTELNPAELRGAAAAIMANHAQHISILRMQLGLTPIPDAFVSSPE